MNPAESTNTTYRYKSFPGSLNLIHCPLICCGFEASASSFVFHDKIYRNNVRYMRLGNKKLVSSFLSRSFDSRITNIPPRTSIMDVGNLPTWVGTCWATSRKRPVPKYFPALSLGLVTDDSDGYFLRYRNLYKFFIK